MQNPWVNIGLLCPGFEINGQKNGSCAGPVGKNSQYGENISKCPRDEGLSPKANPVTGIFFMILRRGRKIFRPYAKP